MCAATPMEMAFSGSFFGPAVTALHSGFEQSSPTRVETARLTRVLKSSRRRLITTASSFELDTNKSRKVQPVPRVRNAPASASIRGVGLRNIECRHYGRHSDSDEARTNFLTIELLVEPIRFVRWIPGLLRRSMSPLRRGTQSLCFCNQRNHSSQLCCLAKIFAGDGENTASTVSPAPYGFSATPANTRRLWR
jgi:hypothetical protein